MGFGHRGFMGLLAGLCVLGAGSSTHAQGLCRAELSDRIDAIATQPSLRHAHLGILVETLGRTAAQRQVVYAHNPEQSFIPASNMKLLTTAAALHYLGPDYRVRTVVYGNQNNGLTTLQVLGKGDPSLGDNQLQELAQQLADQGMTRVTNLIGYDGYFPGPAINPNWEWEDVQAGYGAEINGLMWNENELMLTLTPQAPGQPLGVQWSTPLQPWQVENYAQTVSTGESTISVWRGFSQPIFRIYGQLPISAGTETLSLALPNPANFFVQRFQQLLQDAGVTVLQTSVTAQATPSSTTEVAAVDSAPLSDWINKANQRSNNQYAEALLKTLGMAYSSGATTDATTAGTEAVQAILKPLGVDPSTYQMADGSGLSRHNLVSPSTLVNTLQAMAFVPEAETYRNSLSVAGERGTLTNRFRNTPVQGQLQGKTGAVSNNVSLSGYFDPPSYPPVVLSILVNNARQSSGTLRDIIDDIVLEIAKLNDC